MSNDASNDVKDLGGRPSIYSDDLADELCLRIANGLSLSEVCRSNDMPSKAIVYKWLADDAGFLDRYREATSQRADYHFDEMLDIADKVLPETAEVAKARLQIDTRKWILSRMNPTKYGDKQQVDNVSSDGSMSPPQPLTPDAAQAISKDLDDEY